MGSPEVSERAKPCPFCGNKGLDLVHQPRPSLNAWVACGACLSEGPAVVGEAAAIQAWNRALRPEAPAVSSTSRLETTVVRWLTTRTMTVTHAGRLGDPLTMCGRSISPRAQQERGVPECKVCLAAIRHELREVGHA